MLLWGNLIPLQTHIFPSSIDLKDFVLENGKRCPKKTNMELNNR